MTSVILHTFKLATWDVLIDIVRFPVWWYTEGLYMMWHKTFGAIMRWQYRLGLGIWIKNWLRPMYAQYDFQGRLLSFFFRTITIIWKSIVFLFGFIFIFITFLVYLLLPFVAVVFLFARFVL